jgi:hypothetical protein
METLLNVLENELLNLGKVHRKRRAFEVEGPSGSSDESCHTGDAHFEAVSSPTSTSFATEITQCKRRRTSSNLGRSPRSAIKSNGE